MGINGAVLYLSSDVAKLEKSTQSDKDDERCGVPVILEVISCVKNKPFEIRNIIMLFTILYKKRDKTPLLYKQLRLKQQKLGRVYLHLLGARQHSDIQDFSHSDNQWRDRERFWSTNLQVLKTATINSCLKRHTLPSILESLKN